MKCSIKLTNTPLYTYIYMIFFTIVKEPELHFDSESQDKSLFADLIENIT